ncbi:hypothetical protein SAMN05421595_1756 [Austwickia chelonae]|uniref:Fibronectin type-III domain-containing protein n=1 Tax=Austwickia chelonae NBRC 105200 TaxID=1184607 RepID=K6V3I1_9MICO|nr:Ig-like domain-containing protein [Austwickia chelonae]GAB76623.1 hypothetical protein AUCHE_01_01850 [Austwickia chelonae NBRC 105200]SEW28221.1 hypothetical protein SAMN05421595_1756 [Austwickia chelonae]
MTRWSKGLRALAAVCVVTIVAATVLLVVRSRGYDQTRVTPDDGTVWVSADSLGMFGRVSLPDGALDAAFPPPGERQAAYQLDLFQAGPAVVARDRTSGRAYPVDLTRGKALEDEGVAVPSSWTMDSGGTTVAALDPVSGDVRLAQADHDGKASVSGLTSATKPSFSVGSDAGASQSGRRSDLAVGLDGRVYVASTSGHVSTRRPGVDDEVKKIDLGGRLQDVRVTAVGDRPVVLDPKQRVVVLPGERRVPLPGTPGDSVLQRPGPEADEVLVAGSKELFAISLADGAVRTLSSDGIGYPARPVRQGECVAAAWAGAQAVAVRGCGEDAPKKVRLSKDDGGLQTPDLRARGTSVVLNDVARGSVWDLSTGKRLDNWSTVKPPTKEGKTGKDDKDRTSNQPKAPKAVADEYGVRPGRSSVLHLLDNDSNPGGAVIAISSVSSPSDSRVRTTISADGQSVQVVVPDNVGTVNFTYTITDGRGLSSSAPVTLKARAPKDNAPPHLRAGHKPRSYAVPSGGHVAVPVLADWRDDKDNDPVSVVSASAQGMQVSVSKDGNIDISAAAGKGHRQVSYEVSDGHSTAKGSIDLEVLAPGATTASPPTAMPDFVSGQVGRPIVIRPLDNDLPGADPATPSARLRLAGDVSSAEGLAVTTNRNEGTVTVTAARPGTFFLPYGVIYGGAPMAKSTIRVDVAQVVKDAPPIAVMDTAVVRGQGAVTVDALANDISPSGRILAVSRAESADPSQLQVGVVRGRWLRIQPKKPQLAPSQQVVRYTVEDGSNSAVTGSVIVTQLPALPQSVPVTSEDHATVRVGDNVTIPVLDNDEDPGGSQLEIVQDVPGAPAPGRLVVTVDGKESTDHGSAYVSGRVVRFQAPQTIQNRTTVQITYLVQNSSGLEAKGQAHVVIEPEPGQGNPNREPEPPEIEGRIVAGDTTTLQISATGVDPDGDSVALIGIASAPSLGRVMGFTPGTLTYQAYPMSGGTDSFSYVVQDKYGKRGTGTVRLAVVPPGDPQPPMAVDDTIVAQPGATVRFDPLANDLVATGDKVRINDLKETNGAAVEGAKLDSPRGPIEATIGTGTQPVTFRYALTNGLGTPSVATVTLRARAGYRMAPVAANTQATVKDGETSVTVNVLDKVRDPDGDGSGLRVSQVFAQDATAQGGQVTVPLGAHPRFVAYEVTDREGASTMAVLTVPATGQGLPYPAPDKVIEVPKNGSVKVDLSDYVRHPAGKKVSVVPGSAISSSPEGMLDVKAVEATQIQVSAKTDYVGPAAISLQVSENADGSDAQNKAALVSIPVQVGPETPVLRCPSSTLGVVVGGPEQRFDVMALCHVWTAKPGGAEKLRFRGQLSGETSGLQLSNPDNHTVALSANGNAREGQRATLSISVPGTEAKPATVAVTVRSPHPPTLAPITLDGVAAGQTASVNLAGYISSPLSSPRLSVVSLEQAGGSRARRDVNGLNVSITPDAGAKGVLTFSVVVSDVSDRSRSDRQGRGTITVRVIGTPDAPGTPAPSGPPQSGAVVLTWAVPNNNGSPIDRYQVSWPGGTQDCATVPCAISGLRNGASFPFRVKAHNSVGWGPESPVSAPVLVDARPGPVRDARVAQGEAGSLVLAWSPPESVGSPVTSYVVTWPGGRMVTAATQVVVRGLDAAGPVSLTIVAVNQVGPGEPVTVTGQAAGRPRTPGAPLLSAVADGKGNARVAISWTPVLPNGPQPLTYTVTRTGPSGTTTVCSTGMISCKDTVPSDGGEYAYSVTATNGAGLSSDPGPSASIVAEGGPGQPTDVSAERTPQGKVLLTFTSPRATKPVTVQCLLGTASCSGSPWNFSAPEKVTRTLEPVPGALTVTLTACNQGSRTQCSAPLTVPIKGEQNSDVKVKVGASGPSIGYEVSTPGAPAGSSLTVTVVAGGRTVSSQQFTTGAGDAWAAKQTVRVGYAQKVTVTAVLTTPKGNRTAKAAVETSQAKVALTGAGSTSPIPVTIDVAGMAPSATVVCTVTNRTRSASADVNVATDTSGRGTAAIPPDRLRAQARDVVIATCDRGGNDGGVSSPPTTLPTKP